MKHKTVIILFLFLNLCIFSDEDSGISYQNYQKTEYKNIKWDFYVMLGYNNLENQNNNKAIKYFEKALYLGCKSPIIINDIIDLYIKQNLDNKILDLVETIEDNTIKLDIYRKVSEIYFRSEKFDYFIKFYKKTNSEDEAYIRLGDLFFLKNVYDSALYYYSRINNEKRVDILKEKGMYFLQQKKYDLAIKYLKIIPDTKKISEIEEILRIENLKKIKPIKVIFYNTTSTDIYFEITFSGNNNSKKYIFRSTISGSGLYSYSEKYLNFDWNIDYGNTIFCTVKILSFGDWETYMPEFIIIDNIKNVFGISYKWSDIYGKFIINYGTQ